VGCVWVCGGVRRLELGMNSKLNFKEKRGGWRKVKEGKGSRVMSPGRCLRLIVSHDDAEEGGWL